MTKGRCMERSKLANKLLRIISEGDEIRPAEILRFTKYRREPYTHGIYLLYDVEDHIIYVGQLKGVDSSSLYQRFYGQGEKSHRYKRWFGEIAYLKFKLLDRIYDKHLDIVERLVILAAGQPIYNDVDTDPARLDQYNWDDFTLQCWGLDTDFVKESDAKKAEAGVAIRDRGEGSKQ